MLSVVVVEGAHIKPPVPELLRMKRNERIEREKDEGREIKVSSPSIIPPALVSLLPIRLRSASLFQIAGPFYACSGTPRCEISQCPMLVVCLNAVWRCVRAYTCASA